MKKSILSILLALLPFVANAEPVEIGGIWYNLLSKAKTAIVTRNPNVDIESAWFSGSCEIPASVTHGGVTYSVTSIGGYAFLGCSGLTSVTIPNSVTSIGGDAFGGCSSLTSISVDDGNTKYDSRNNCNAIIEKETNTLLVGCKNTVIPSSVTSIGGYVFFGCSGLTSVTIPNSVTSIGGYAFGGCSCLTSVTIPNSVTSIGYGAFNGCSSLTSITIPNSVTSIEWNAFKGCSGLTSVTIPNSVTNIGDKAFYGCSGLTSVTIPNSVTSICPSAFSGCSSLTSITIPNSVTSIGSSAFQGCSRLTSVTIGSGVTSIIVSAFANCPELTDVTCLAEKLRTDEWSGEGLYTYADAFDGSYIEYVTLHVPAASIPSYNSMEPWSKFKSITPIGDGEIPETPKCATPTITYSDGKITFSCDTEGVEYISSVSAGDSKNYYDGEITLTNKYTVTVYATKAGYDDSDTATLEIVGSAGVFGDLTGDGQVNAADHVKLSEIIMRQ